MYFFTTKGKNLYCEADYEDNCFLIFGREDAGIDEEILHNNPDTCVRLPMNKEARSLNLSNTVAIATYEVLRQWNFPELKFKGQLTKYND